MEKTLSSLIVEVTNGYMEGRILSFKVEKKGREYDALTITYKQHENEESVSCWFNDNVHWIDECKGKPCEYAEEVDYDFILKVVRGEEE